MKYPILFFCLLGLYSCSSDSTEEVNTGGIAGSVSDRTTGEPVATVNVTLSPGGKSTVTGNDGSFSFVDLEPDDYTIDIRKEGYNPNSSRIRVAAGQQSQAHLLIERIPAIVSADREELDFGENAGVNTLSFGIINSSYEDLSWQIEHDCKWIKEIRPASGVLKLGKTETIVVIIDRELLSAGNNETVLVVRSTNGRAEVKIKAVGAERDTPRLNILDATKITSSTATLNGEILAAGIPAYTERGFVYSLNSMPTFDNMLAKLTAPVTGDNTYSYNLRGLTLGETYYVRAYATNSVGTAYSANEINFMTISSQPKVSVDGVSGINVTKGSATFKGTIVDAGDPAYFERGFVYGTIHNPTLNDTKITVNGTGIGEFSADVTGLQLDERYYLRAYATSKIGETEQTVYSDNEIQFALSSTAPIVSTQAVTNLNVSAGSATFNGTVESVGNPAYAERGFVYGLTSNPTVDDTKIVVNGTGAGAFSIGVSGLLPDQKYYVRAYAINATQTAYSADNVTFTLTSTAPEVSIQAAEDVDVETGEASLYGLIVSVGDPAYTECGFVYALWNNPTLDDSEKAIVTKSGTGVFRTRVTGLSLEKTYYVRAYATNLAGTAYSSEITVSTKATLPQVETLEAADVDISTGTAMLRGNIVNTGSPTYSECGFVYSTIATNPTINDNKIVSSASGATGSFSVYTTELPANKTVYVRAYATNRGGTAYGETTALEPAWIELPAVGIAVQRKDIGYGPWNSVNAMCENSIIGGYTDWRLPSIDELIVLYNNRTNIGGFYTDNASEAYYWSGSQDTTVVSKILYYEFDFWNGTMNSLEIKDFGSFVHKCSGRCVRTLNPTTTNR
ncbi:carboxypeptidase regulatory-like domain-containing protein [Alistipes sp. UBA6068]|uniref:carboxypeptidase regulatory-like domain-containing protein n=1 Tax=unclassified Alistipes TaxID=2608932 RepID=UPI00259AC664|nr:carboxypeptidase regulatory-like domain-containing protein [Alistipes sp. UBA6068]